jgi:gamma-glutamyltranspeptidase/glutathione hydrolase
MEPDLDRFESRRSTVHAPNGVVATSQPLAARVGVSVLEDGGNAFDAAVATAAALNVVEPTSTGLGGDVFALYRTADGEVGGLRSCGSAPAGDDQLHPPGRGRQRERVPRVVLPGRRTGERHESGE